MDALRRPGWLRTVRWVVAIVVVVVTLATPADACIHPPAEGGAANPSSTVRVGQTGQQGLLIHDGKRQQLVLRVDLDTSQPLERLAWIVPVPTEPERYETASTALFDELGKWVGLRRVIPPPPKRDRGPFRGMGDDQAPAAAATPSPIRFLPATDAGPYSIQPIVAVGEAGVKALGEWFVDNAFAPMEPKQLAYYVDRGWTFLAIRIDPAKGQKTLSKRGGLPPLRVSFAAPWAVYPLKLSSHQGVFPVRLYIITRDELDDEAFSTPRKRGFEVAAAPNETHLRSPGGGPGTLTSNVARFTADDAPTELRALLKAAGLSGTLHLRTLLAPQFGKGVGEPDDWDEDLAIPTPAGELRVEPVKPDEPPAPKPVASAAAAPSVFPAVSHDPPESSGCSFARTRSRGGDWLLVMLMASLCVARSWSRRLSVAGSGSRIHVRCTSNRRDC